MFLEVLEQTLELLAFPAQSVDVLQQAVDLLVSYGESRFAVSQDIQSENLDQRTDKRCGVHAPVFRFGRLHECRQLPGGGLRDRTACGDQRVAVSRFPEIATGQRSGQQLLQRLLARSQLGADIHAIGQHLAQRPPADVPIREDRSLPARIVEGRPARLEAG